MYQTDCFPRNTAQWLGQSQVDENAREFIALVKDTNKDLLKDLDKRSESLVALREAFPEWLRTHAGEVEILCFFEALNSCTGSKVHFHLLVPQP